MVVAPDKDVLQGQEACRLNGGNVHDTGHSSEAVPMAALAEKLKLFVGKDDTLFLAPGSSQFLVR